MQLSPPPSGSMIITEYKIGPELKKKNTSSKGTCEKATGVHNWKIHKNANFPKLHLWMDWSISENFNKAIEKDDRS